MTKMRMWLCCCAATASLAGLPGISLAQQQTDKRTDDRVRPAATAQVEADTSEPDQADVAAARAALEDAAARYRGLKSYRGKYRYEARTAAKGAAGPELGYLEGSLLFAAPNRLVSRSDGLDVYYDGERLTRYRPAMGQYTVQEQPQALRRLLADQSAILGEDQTAIHPLAGLLAVPELSVEEALFIDALAGVKPDTREGRSGRRVSGWLRGSLMPSVSRIPFTVFIDDETGLFVEFRLELTEAAATLAGIAPEDEQRPEVESAELVLTFPEEELDGDVPDDAFAFDAAGARKVDMFGMVAQRVDSPLELLGQTAPPLKGRTLDGGEFDLSSQRGRVMVVAFWGTWAPGSDRLLRDLQQLATEMGPQLVVVGVNRNGSAGEQAARAAVAQSGAAFPEVADRTGELADAWHVSALPVVFLVDRQGQVAEAYPNWSDRTLAAVTGQLERLLESEPIHTASELAARRAQAGDVDQVGGAVLSVAADAAAAGERLKVISSRQLNASQWNMTEQDLDGDGTPELILPDWSGGISVVNPVTDEVRRLHLAGLEGHALQSVRGVAVDGETCWLCAGTSSVGLSERSMRQSPYVRLFSPGGELLFSFRPEVPEDANASAVADGGDLDGDGKVEYAIGLTTYVWRRLSENSYASEGMKAQLLVLDHGGRVIARRDVPGQIELLHVTAARDGQPGTILCLSGGQLERYALGPEEATE